MDYMIKYERKSMKRIIGKLSKQKKKKKKKSLDDGTAAVNLF